MAERLFRAISPTPAYATALLGKTGGGSKPALSPFGIINPGKVNLGTFFQSPKKSGNITNKPLTPTPIVKPKSNGGIAFKQTDVLAYLLPIVNNGTPGRICFNWAYNDDQGRRTSDRAVYTKAGGLSLVRQERGDVQRPGTDRRGRAAVLAGGTPRHQPRVSSQERWDPRSRCVRCSTGRRTSPISWIPRHRSSTFDPTDAGTFPPNYDVVAFPGYQ